MTSRGAFLNKLTHRLVLGSRVAAFIVLLASLALTFEGKLWVSQLGDVSSISLGSVSVIYVLSQYRFTKGGYTELKSIVLAVLFANAFLQVYELIYGLTFALSGPPSVSGAELRTFLLWVIMISPFLLVHDNLRFTRTSAALLVLFGAAWVAWILYGFPQYYYQGYAFSQILTTTDHYQLSLWLNFGSKALLAALFVSLLEPVKALNNALDRPSPIQAS